MSVELSEIEAAEVELAENGIPESVRIGLLRDYADNIEHLGYVLRMWGHNDH